MYAKITPPDTSALLVRQRLHQRLDSSRGHVVCVCGPAGAGKSSLLAAWSGRLEQHVVWYRVDADDRDIASFFDWFGRTLTSEGQLSLPVLSAEHLFNPEHFARRFFRAYFVALPESAVLVLDNIHEALDAPEFAHMLPILADERRPGTTLVLSSRNQPTGAMLALMAKPENSHIGWADLRCTDDEAAELARSQTLPAPTADILRRADGWMAALALLLRQAALDLPGTWPSLRDAEVFETLAARAFDTLAPTQQQWLLVNAHSPWIDADSTDRLCGTTGAANGLDALSRARFFIERQHSGNRVRYVCHALLRAFLQHRAQAIWPGATIRQHARHHAAACDALGDPDAAIALYALAEAWPAAAEVILRQAPALLAAGKLATLLEWIRRLPADVAQDLPSLAYWEGLCHLLFVPQEAVACLQRAHAGHVAEGRLLDALFDVCALMDAYFAQWDGWSEARTWANELTRLYALVEGHFPSLDVEVRVIAAGGSLMFPAFDLPLVGHWLARAETLLRTSPVPQHQLMLAGFVIGHCWWSGEMATMREASRIASHALTEARPGPFVSFHLHMWIGIAAYSDGLATDPGLSGHLDRVLELGDQQGIHLFDFHAWCHKIMEAMAVDDIAAGATALQAAKALDPGLRGTRLLLTLCEIGQRMMERDWPAAVKLAEESLTASPEFGGWVFGAQSLRVGLAQALTMLGEHERASRHLAGPLDFARRLPSPYFHMMANFIQAAGAYARHDLERGDAHLRAALGIARAKGFRHFHPWWSPPFFAPLLARALEADIEADWVTLLIARQRVKPPAADAHAWSYPIRMHVLGRFSVRLNGAPLAQQGKAQRRVLELLKLLAAQGGRSIPVETLADTLWPNGDGAAGLDAFDVTLHRARKLLGEPTALLLHDGRLSLNPDLVWLDIGALGHATARIERALAGDAPGPTALENWIRSLTQLYPAPLLKYEPDSGWLLQARDTWRRRVERHARQLAAVCQRLDATPLAVELYARLAEADPAHESFVAEHARLAQEPGRRPAGDGARK